MSGHVCRCALQGDLYQTGQNSTGTARSGNQSVSIIWQRLMGFTESAKRESRQTGEPAALD